MVKRVVISPGYGAGWATWANTERKQAIAEYEPIIEYLEEGGDPSALDDKHPLVVQMMADFGLSYFYTGGADQLEVVTVDGPYLINEYDGFESVVTAEDFWE